jgi:muramoyltetrapeptide carboxypeptidase
MTATRRTVMGGLGAGVSLLAGAGTAASTSGMPHRIVKPRRLVPGDTIGLIEPASATFEPFDLTLVEETVSALGFVPRRGQHLLSSFGYLAGQDRDRAADVNAMFADPAVKAILAVRGGWGCARILPFLDFAMIARNPKPLIGFSDITALHLALQAHAPMVSMHGPNGASAWGPVSVASFRELLVEAKAPTLRNPVAEEPRLVQRRWRTQTIRGGVARGRLIGGNLTVLTALVGTPYLPSLKGRLLFLEDVDEAEYRVDRMFTQLALAGHLRAVAGVVFGQCTDCVPPERGFGGFPLSAVLRQHLEPLGVPAFFGAFFGHIADQPFIPQGVMAELDADAGTLRLLEPAVA